MGGKGSFSRQARVRRTFFRLFFFSYLAFCLLLSLGILLISARLHTSFSNPYSADSLSNDILPQLRYIRQALERGEGTRMQRYFPEGYFYSHALFAMAWVQVGMNAPLIHAALGRGPGCSDIRRQAISNALWALLKMESEEGRKPFISMPLYGEELRLPLGAFYRAHCALVRGGVLKLAPPEKRKGPLAERFRADCKEIARALRDSPTPFLESYRNSTWPVDSMVCVAALRLHDDIFPPEYGELVKDWVERAKAYADPDTGFLPHRVDAMNAEEREMARGTSQAIAARFLPDIDPGWALHHYRGMRRVFYRTLWGIPGTLEYPPGVEGFADVDSGPLIKGFSTSGTVVAAGAARVFGDEDFAQAVFQEVEAFGFPVILDGGKRYGGGLFPVGDAFLVWSKTARPWVGRVARVGRGRFSQFPGRFWRWPVLGICLGVLMLAWAPVFLLLRRRRKNI